jgi:catechol 2,3-dioxygenase-like lactoylglutathione lyase family enzyme
MAKKRTSGPIVKSEAIQAVADAPATAKFYREKLGFTKEWFWDNPPMHVGVEFGGVSLMFHLDAQVAKQLEGHEHYFHVQGVDDLYARHRKNGVPVISPLGRKPRDMREYTVRDPNDYPLILGESCRSDQIGS